MAPSDADGSPRRALPSLAEGKRFEAYVERQTGEMRVCLFCERIFYRQKPIRRIGNRWVCIDCLRALKEAVDGLDRWEEMTVLHQELETNASQGTKR